MKRMAVMFAAVALTGLVAALPALAETRVHEGAQVEVWIPEGWDAEFEGDTMTISDDAEDTSIAVVFTILKCSELGEALELLEKEVEENVSKLKVDEEPEEMNINGMDALSVDAKGEIEGEAVELGFVILNTPNDKILMIVGIGTAESIEANQEKLEKILTSIAPHTADEGAEGEEEGGDED